MKQIISLFLLISIFACTLASCSLLSSGEQSDDTQPTVTIVSFEKTKTEGLVDTYTMTFSDGTTAEVNVTNGKDGANGVGVTVSKVEKTMSTGNVDVYTMFFSDGTQFSFNVSNGKEGKPGATGANGKDGITITSIDKTSSNALGDVYTIYYSNGTSTNFTIAAHKAADLSGFELESENASGDLTFKFTYSDQTTSRFTIRGSAERSEVLLAYDEARTKGYSGTAAEWVCEALNVLKTKFLGSGSMVNAKDVGLAAKKILDNFYTYFEVNSYVLDVKTTTYEVNETSGYYFSQKIQSSSSYTCHPEYVAISLGDVLKVVDDKGNEYKLKFVDVYTANGTHLTSTNANGNPTTYFSADGKTSFTVVATADGQVPTTAGVSWYHTWNSSSSPQFSIVLTHSTYSAPAPTASAELSEDAILSIIGSGSGSGGGYISEGDSNVIISTVLGQPALTMSKNALAAGEKLTLLSENIVLNGKCISLSADIEGEFKNGSSVSVGTGENVKYGMFVTVTATEITVQYNNTDPVIKKYTHGLQIKDYLNIVIDISEASACIRIMTSSGLYEIKSISWNGRRGEVFAKATGQNVNNATIRWYAKSLSSKIWLFGDSYFNYTANARWTYYLKNAGYTDNCQFGFPGMGTADALKAFKWATELGYAPKYAVWCMGMNNGDTLGSSTVNAGWLDATTEFLAICNELGITPILATIPSTPTVFNENKNAWIEASGYRYIDFARAVGARYDAAKISSTNKTGYYWYDGMLSTDLVHPDVLGAKALYMQFITDFPEITE